MPAKSARVLKLSSRETVGTRKRVGDSVAVVSLMGWRSVRMCWLPFPGGWEAAIHQDVLDGTRSCSAPAVPAAKRDVTPRDSTQMLRRRFQAKSDSSPRK